jgi:hypothetical protein
VTEKTSSTSFGPRIGSDAFGGVIAGMVDLLGTPWSAESKGKADNAGVSSWFRHGSAVLVESCEPSPSSERIENVGVSLLTMHSTPTLDCGAPPLPLRHPAVKRGIVQR